MSFSDSPVVESGKTRTVLDNKDGDPHMVVMETLQKKEPVKKTFTIEVISSKELAAVSVDGKNVSFCFGILVV